MTTMLASTLVVLIGLYFVGLAVVSLLAPARAARFLLGFASSASAHYLELFLRIVAGVAILLNAPHMLFADVFVVFGWLLIVTTAGLLVIPWRWHHRFAQRSVPYALRYLKLVAVTSLLFGVFVLVAVILGAA